MSKVAAIRSLKGDAAAGQEILKAIGKAGGSRKEAAAALGVAVTTLYRLIGELDLWDRIDAYCRERGFSTRAGRPRGEVPERVRIRIRDGRREALRGS